MNNPEIEVIFEVIFSDKRFISLLEKEAKEGKHVILAKTWVLSIKQGC